LQSEGSKTQIGSDEMLEAGYDSAHSMILEMVKLVSHVARLANASQAKELVRSFRETADM